jgi:hypothetical protein
MTLSTLAVGLGLLVSIPHAYAFWRPAEYGAALRKFPRSTACGYLLMGLATVWFLYNLNRETISDFAAYRDMLLFGFGLLGLLSCLYVKDFLAVRGLAVVLLLLSKVVLDTARWNDSLWRLFLAAGAYACVLSAMWLIVSPWRLRDFISWKTANEKRIRLSSAISAGVGLFIIVLGLTAF